jgi:dCTP deaminase
MKKGMHTLKASKIISDVADRKRLPQFTSGSLFPEVQIKRNVSPRSGDTGILPSQTIKAMVDTGEIYTALEISDEIQHDMLREGERGKINDDQIQPASIDLRLGKEAYCVEASFLPGPDSKVLPKIERLKKYKMDIRSGALLEKGRVYVIPLLESLALKAKSEITGFANPKSSTGRLDILTRLITDEGTAFDQVRRSYKGPLYLEVAPLTFDIEVRTGTRLNQLRFRRGSPPPLAAKVLEELHGTILPSDGNKIKDKKRELLLEKKLLPVTVDLKGTGEGSRIGFRAKQNATSIDVEKIGHYNVDDFWEPIHANERAQLILQPNEFYILVTKEPVPVPPGYAAEMVAYDTTIGEFRVHYAGFFDPGFGWNDKAGKPGSSKAVLEVRSHDVPFLMEHGQTVGWLNYEKMRAIPNKLYGQDIRSNYQGQSLKLAKQFRLPEEK